MEGGVRNCKGMAFWDLYPKKSLTGYPIVKLRCPYWRVQCPHRDPKEDGRSFCSNEPLADEIRAQGVKEKITPLPEKKKPAPQAPGNVPDGEEKKAA